MYVYCIIETDTFRFFEGKKGFFVVLSSDLERGKSSLLLLV